MTVGRALGAGARLVMPAAAASFVMLTAALGCAADGGGGRVVRISGSALGAEGEVLTRQLARFEAQHPGVRVEIQRTPDDATQRHQLYVQWLNARVGDPDILQLDVVWTPEFAAAGWILPLGRFAPDTADFFAATIAANRWDGELHAVPWFVDVGLLYRRTDLVPEEPRDLAALADAAGRGTMGATGAARHGFVFQGARYEGLITVFVEILGAFGGRILDDEDRVIVDAPEGVRALEFLTRLLEDGVVPRDVLSWHEEETRFAFQNDEAVFMRNWPYAYSLLADSAQSRVAGRYAVGPMPAAPDSMAPSGAPSTALGGAQLAINRWSDQPGEAWSVIAFLTAPEQMLERAEAVGQFPPRPALYDDPRLADALAIPADDARRAIERAIPRPVTPIWTEMSEILQIEVHRALARQVTPEQALRDAAARMRALIERSGLAERRDAR